MINTKFSHYSNAITASCQVKISKILPPTLPQPILFRRSYGKSCLLKSYHSYFSPIAIDPIKRYFQIIPVWAAQPYPVLYA